MGAWQNDKGLSMDDKDKEFENPSEIFGAAKSFINASRSEQQVFWQRSCDASSPISVVIALISGRLDAANILPRESFDTESSDGERNGVRLMILYHQP